MITKEKRKEVGLSILEWVEKYYNELPGMAVKSNVKPGQIYNKLETSIPIEGTDIKHILLELDERLIPGITHWQHANFHAYFPANSSYESAFAEFITAAIGAQCMIWDTSPAAAELEEKVLNWMRDALGLPANFEGVIQDTASSASLVAILTAREKATNMESNLNGVPGNLRVYCSTQTHSSIEKGVKIAGIGSRNLVKIEVDENMAMDPVKLEEAILNDFKNGLEPCCVIAAIGTTSTLAVDPLPQIGKICKKYGIWLHVDAAYAGIACLLPEYQWMLKGVENADSIVINAHKWMFTNFDCSLYYVKDAKLLIDTFEILPEYLRTSTRGQVNDYRDWGIPLGRRFRALKLWFVMKSWGLKAIQDRIKSHIKLTKYAETKFRDHPDFEVMVPAFLNYLAFRYVPDEKLDLSKLNSVNEKLLNQINQSGEIFITHTKKKGVYIIRLLFGQTYVQKEDVDKALNCIFSNAELITQTLFDK